MNNSLQQLTKESGSQKKPAALNCGAAHESCNAISPAAPEAVGRD
jgi:hypothetical protein